MLTWFVGLVGAAAPALAGAPVGAAVPKQSDEAFEKEIRPVLVAKCFSCHGPKKQQSGLRVDSREFLLKGGDSGPAVVPGKPDEGSLLKALLQEHDLKMPPKEKLPPATLQAFQHWVASGAPWPASDSTASSGRTAVIMDSDRKHWAFQPLRVANPPPVTQANGGTSDIDRYIMAGWQSKNLKPVGLADKRTLIRRATLDLTGLPPTPQEIQDFLADDRVDAFAALIERLLASPAYGERWGRHWLDVARYADTAGDGADYPVPEAWRYRNWVIDAFQNDMPYDRFLREQIAGDLIASQSRASDYAQKVIATGFLAVGKRYGYNPGPDFQHLDYADVIESVGRSILGLSLGCARCHDHKYEPIGMEDYYALYGIFQSTRWAFPGGEEHKKPAHLVPLVPAETARQLERKQETEAEDWAAKIRALKKEKGAIDGSLRAGGKDLDWEGQSQGKAPGGVWLAMGPNTILPESQSPFCHIHPQGKQGVRMGSGMPHDGIRYVFAEPFRAQDARYLHFSFDFRNLPGSAPGAYRLYLGRGVIASTALDLSVSASEFAVKNGANWETIAKVDPQKWYSVELTIDTQAKTYSGNLWGPDQPVPFTKKAVNPAWDGVIDTLICDGLGHKSGPVPVHDLDNFGLSEQPFARPGTQTVVVKPPGAEDSARLKALESELANGAAQLARVKAAKPYPVAYAVSEGVPSDAKIQKRGEPDKPGPVAARRFLEILGGDRLKDQKASGRLELAEWLTRPTNPLTARVFVNRVWQWHFGKGLVPTPSDFGLRGEGPSHPELLDHLAARFIASGWSVKELHRTIMTSQVYRLACADLPENLAIDPENRFLWKFARRPLEAEAIRDGFLFLSGKLDRKRPEGHPFPPVESWGYTIHNPFHAVYEHQSRSVYLMIQRNRRHPFLAMFDAADPNLSVAGRLPTTTPVQALYLLNGPLIHEQSLLLADKLLSSEANDPERVKLLVEMTQGQQAESRDVQAALDFVKDYARQCAQDGHNPAQSRRSSWAALCRAYMTSNPALHLQ